MKRHLRVLGRFAAEQYKAFDEAYDTVVRPRDDVTCRPGCTACCRQLVVVTASEAALIVDTQSSLVILARKKLQEQARFLQEEGLRDRILVTDPDFGAELEQLAEKYWHANFSCVFLKNGLCSIYAVRPLACRSYAVTSDKALCEAPLGGTQVTVIKLNGENVVRRRILENEQRPLLSPLPVLLLQTLEA